MRAKYIISLMFIFCYTYYYTQTRVQFEIGVASTFSAFGKYNARKTIPIDNTKRLEYSDYGYIGFNVFIGSVISFKNTSFLFQIQHQRVVSGLFYELIDRDRLRKSNLIGINLGFRFLEKSRFKPFVQIKTLSEIQSNYVNKSIYAFGPTNSDAPLYYGYYYQGHGISPIEILQITLYKSTPFIGELLGGCAVRIVDGLNFNFSIGYNLSILNYKYATFEYDNYVKEDYQTKLRNSPMHSVFLHALTAQLGLSYTFSFNKKPKTEKLGEL